MSSTTVKNKIFGLFKNELNIFIFLILSIVAGTLLSPNFLDIKFLLHSATLYTELGIIAIAFTLLMTSGEIDLSIASTMTLVACVVATLYQSGISMALLIPLGLVLGAILGLINGLIVVSTKLPSLIITIGTMSVYKGFAQVLVGDKAISNFPEWFIGFDKRALFGIIPLPLIVFIVIAIIMGIILNKTFWGRKVTAIGLSKDAANYSAVKVDKIKIFLFSMQGFFCAIAGLMSISRLEVAKYSIGAGGEMDVITMVLLGGTAFVGGKGSIFGTTIAFFILMFIRTGMTLAIMSSYQQISVLGLLLIIIIIISQKIEKINKERN